MAQRVYIPGVGFRNIGETPTIDVFYDLNGEIHYSIENPSTGSGATEAIILGQDLSDFNKYSHFSNFNSGYSGTLYTQPNSATLRSGGANGLVIQASNATGSIKFVTGSLNDASSLRLTIAANGDISTADTVFYYNNTTKNLRLLAFGATNIPLTVKAAAAQTANLQEWQNSAGTTLINISSTGAIQTTSVLQLGNFGDKTMLFSPAMGKLRLSDSNTGTVGLQLDVSGNTLSVKDTTGASAVGVVCGSLTAGNTILTAPSAAIIGLVVKAAASQTANLTEWRNSVNTLFAAMGVDGHLGLNNNNKSSTSIINFSSGERIDTAATAYGINGNVINASSGNIIGYASTVETRYVGTTGTLKGFQTTCRINNAGNTTSSAISNFSASPAIIAGAVTNAYGFWIEAQKISGVTTGYGLYAPGVSDINYFGGVIGVNTLTPGAMLGITSSAASTKGLIVKGAASQTANLQEWQDSSAIVQVAINSVGDLRFTSKIPSGGTFQIKANTGAIFTEPTFYLGLAGYESNGLAFRSNGFFQAPNGLSMGTSGDFLFGYLNNYGILRGVSGQGFFLLTEAEPTSSRYTFSAGSIANANCLFKGRTSTTDSTAIALNRIDWADNTHASRKGRVRHIVYDTAERECLRLEASGSAPMVGLYGATAVVRAITAGAAATFVANTSLTANDTATFDGYTIGQVVKALRDIGILT